MKHIHLIYLALIAAAFIVSCENVTPPENPSAANSDTDEGDNSIGNGIIGTEPLFFSDGRSFSSFTGPLGTGIGRTDVNGGNTHLNSITSLVEIDNVNDFLPEIQYRYTGSTSGEVSISGELSARTELSAAGFGLEQYSEYHLASLVSHQVYFKALSSDPDTTRISLSAEISFSGNLEYTRENDSLDVTSSIGVEIWLQTMGWRYGELGLEYVPLGPILFNEEGGAIVGYRFSTGIIQSCCRDWFIGQIPPGSTSGNINVTKTALADISPDSIKQLYITVNTSSSFKFVGQGTEFDSSGTSTAEVGSVTWLLSAVDPDNPDADIDIIYYFPTDNP